MTTIELKEKINESRDPDRYNNWEVELKYPQIGFSAKLKGVSAIHEFVSKQIEGYSKYESLPDEINEEKEEFENIKESIENFVTISAVSDYDWHRSVNDPLESEKLLSDSPETEFLIKLYHSYPDCFLGAYEYISRDNLRNTDDKNYLTGCLLAYEFKARTSSDITQRREVEENSLSKVRESYTKYLNETETHQAEYIARSRKQVEESSKQIDEFLKNTQEGYDGWFNQAAQDFSAFYNVSNERIKTLENLYQEKLKLEAPAKYWNDRAKKLRKEGYWWLGGLVVCLGIGVVILIWILNMIAEGTLTKIFASTATAIKWSVALITLISFIAYAIRVISKLTFSAFHLVRDAEEREQLTYVYLALQKEKGIDQTERHLIMQSLFSRADTGLLKDEASPTMPGNIVDKFITK
jgi:hypothetical protein